MLPAGPFIVDHVRSAERAAATAHAVDAAGADDESATDDAGADDAGDFVAHWEPDKKTFTVQLFFRKNAFVGGKNKSAGAFAGNAGVHGGYAAPPPPGALPPGFPPSGAPPPPPPRFA